MNTTTPLSLNGLRAHFEALLRAQNAALDALELAATWRAFAEFSRIPVACDEESLFFECGLSPSNENHFYVHFTRTFIGRDAGNHFWSHELNCDFLLQSDEELEELGFTVESEIESSDERAAFFRDVEAQSGLWKTLGNRPCLSAAIYVGES